MEILIIVDKRTTLWYNIVEFWQKGEDKMEFDKSQLMRGTLEGCVLKVISSKTTYGYEILEYLKNNGFSDLSDSYAP